MKILIVVKAYPAISKKYGETVCTAGITEDGSWIRIYPIPFRKLDYKNRFHKYDWIEWRLIRNRSDFRPETFRPENFDNLKVTGNIKADGDTWEERRKFVLKKVYTSLDDLKKEAKDKTICTSIAVFKPKVVKDFIYKPVKREWKKETLRRLESEKLQGRLFENEDENDIQEFELVSKLPYKFSFVFEDENGQESTLMIEDWETGMLYWNLLKKYEGNEKRACEDVKKKYFDDFAKTKDYHFILGTTKLNHFVAPNPFVIIGDFRPNRIVQERMF